MKNNGKKKLLSIICVVIPITTLPLFECVFDMSVLYNKPYLIITIPIFSIPLCLLVAGINVPKLYIGLITITSFLLPHTLYLLSDTVNIGFMDEDDIFLNIYKTLNDGTQDINKMVYESYVKNNSTLILFGHKILSEDRMLEKDDVLTDINTIIYITKKYIQAKIMNRKDCSDIVVVKITYNNDILNNTGEKELFQMLNGLYLSRYRNLIILVSIPVKDVNEVTMCNVSIDLKDKETIRQILECAISENNEEGDSLSSDYNSVEGYKTDRKRLKLCINRENAVITTVIFLLRHNLREYTSNGIEVLPTSTSIKINYDNEIGLDYGGLSREWIDTMIEFFIDCRENILDEVITEDAKFWLPKYFIVRNIEQEIYLEILGYIAGYCYSDEEFAFGINFHRTVYNFLCGTKNKFDDLQDIEGQMVACVDTYPPNVLCLTYSYTYDFCGEKIEIDLKEDGKSKSVTIKDLQTYKNIYAQVKYGDSLKYQLAAFSRGFKAYYKCECVDPNDINKILSHEQKLTYEKIEHRIMLSTPNTLLNTWFLDIIKEFTSEELRKMLSYITGSQYILSDQTAIFNMEVNIKKSTDSLPEASTCTKTLSLPPYESFEKLKKCLRKVFFEVIVGFESF